MKKLINFIEENSGILCVIILSLLCTFSAVKAVATLAPNNHFVLQADAFLHKSLAIPNPPAALNDLAFFHNQYFVPFGPLPAILLLPFAAVWGTAVDQAWLGYILAALSFILVYRIAGSLGIKSTSSKLWLATAFVFGSVYISLVVLPISAFLVQVVTVFFLLLALDEFFHRKRFFLIGLYLGYAILTRDIIGIAVVFFLYEIAFLPTIKHKIKAIAALFIPMIICSLLVFSFNYVRFGSILDNGYDHNISHGQDLLLSRQEGFFSPKHIPGNLYLLLFKAPDPIKLYDVNYVLKPPYLHVDPWGLGIFFTSPLFVYLLFVSLKEKYAKASLLTIGVILIPTLTYYAYGVWQYGYRHAVDFYPFLFLLLIPLFREKMPLRAKVLILYSIVFNFGYMLSLWGIYFFRQF